MFTHRIFSNAVLLTSMLLVSFAWGAEFAWVPLEATGSYTINGSQIILDGGDQEVTLELYLSGWDPDQNNDPLLAAYQATVDSTGYSSGWGDAVVPVGWPETPTDGAYITTTHADYVFTGVTSIPAVFTATLDYEFGATAFSGIADDGGAYYGGTLIIEVPAGARGTYTIGLLEDSAKTFMRDDGGLAIVPILRSSALITMACEVPADCDDGNECTDDLCDDGTCSNPNSSVGTWCGNPASDLCDAQDTCDGMGNCIARLQPSGEVCRPATGPCDVVEECDGVSVECPADEYEPDETPCPDDGNDCTNDWCISGVCEHPDWPLDTACGSPADTECTDPDTCDGAGTCLPNDAPAGTDCGDPADTDCTDPDTCDGAGTCEPNDEPNGTPCDDELFCTIDEYCTDGVCGDGAFTCDDGVDCTDDTCDEELDVCDNDPNDANCDNGDWCDGLEICDPVEDCIISPGSVPDCDDEVGCTDDSCDEVNDRCLNVANDANCDNGEWCDGFEWCDEILDCQAGTAPDCDDLIDCTEDSCNEVDDICVHVPNDALCPDDGLFCNGDEICLAETGCDHSGNPCSGPCDEENDTCLCDTPIVEAAGSRYLAVSLQPPDAGAQAIVVKAACEAGVPRYVGAVEEVLIKGHGGPTALVGLLTDDPEEALFMTPEEWGDPVYVTGATLAPATTFEVWADCGWPGSPAFSDSTTVVTWKLGDVRHNDVVNFTDVQWQVFAFRNEYNIPGVDITLASVDLEGDDCTPDRIMNFVDILWTILIFKGGSYADLCPEPQECPPCYPADCNDDDECTDDGCDIETGLCWNIPNYDTGTECCDPETAETTPIDDGDACTIDVCDPETGQVSHPPMDCSDTDDCTVDECVDGVCIHTHFETISCVSNSDCPPESPGCAGNCTCPGTPAPFMEWRPVSSSGPYTIEGNEIIIPAGGVQVEFQAWIDEWAPHGIHAYQFRILGETSYVSGDAGSLSPLTDPEPEAGAYIDATWAYYLFKYIPSLEVMNLTTINYVWGAVLYGTGPGVPYEYQDKYCGTLILEVSPDAAGTFTLEFDTDTTTETLLIDGDDLLIRPVTLKPGYITISGE